jgi:hypothetical protein
MQKKSIILLLLAIYFSLFFNTGHLCFCQGLHQDEQVCHCCEHTIDDGLQTKPCNCCLNTKTDITKRSIESTNNTCDNIDNSCKSIVRDISDSLIFEETIKDFELNYAPQSANTDILRSVIMLN